MTGTIKFPTPGWLVYPEPGEAEKMKGKPARWFADQADKSCTDQTSFSADATALLAAAQEATEDELLRDALLRSVAQLISQWDREFCKQFQHMEELISRLHAAETLAGEQA